jgi:hypothetical protein
MHGRRRVPAYNNRIELAACVEVLDAVEPSHHVDEITHHHTGMVGTRL